MPLRNTKANLRVNKSKRRVSAFCFMERRS
nr:MAG TPA: hypothetical protein [Caudoviricetes sp.]